MSQTFCSSIFEKLVITTNCFIIKTIGSQIVIFAIDFSTLPTYCGMLRNNLFSLLQFQVTHVNRKIDFIRYKHIFYIIRTSTLILERLSIHVHIIFLHRRMLYMFVIRTFGRHFDIPKRIRITEHIQLPID